MAATARTRLRRRHAVHATGTFVGRGRRASVRARSASSESIFHGPPWATRAHRSTTSSPASAVGAVLDDPDRARRVDAETGEGRAVSALDDSRSPDYHDFFNALSPTPKTTPPRPPSTCLGGLRRPDKYPRPDFRFVGQVRRRRRTSTSRPGTTKAASPTPWSPKARRWVAAGVGHERNGVFF